MAARLPQQYYPDWFSCPRDENSAHWSHHSQINAGYHGVHLLLQLKGTTSRSVATWTTKYSLELWGKRMTDCNSQLALGSNQQCQEHQSQQQPLISNITVLQIIICSKEAAPFSSQEGETTKQRQERNVNGCSYMLQTEDNFVLKMMSFALQELRTGRGSPMLLSAFGTHTVH